MIKTKTKKLYLSDAPFLGVTDGICHCPKKELSYLYGVSEKGLFKVHSGFCKRCTGKIIKMKGGVKK